MRKSKQINQGLNTTIGTYLVNMYSLTESCTFRWTELKLKTKTFMEHMYLPPFPFWSRDRETWERKIKIHLKNRKIKCKPLWVIIKIIR